MDPTLNVLAYKLRAKLPEQASHHQEIYLEEIHRLRYRLGSLIVSVGQKLQEGELQSQSPSEANMDRCIEAVG